MNLFFDIHTHSISTSNDVFAIRNIYPNSDDFLTPFSVGIHPWFLKKETYENENFLMEKKLQHKNCYAIGECGLDKTIEINFDFQKEIFIKQIELSEKYQKPVIIHCVRAFQEIIELKKSLKPSQPWIIHGFQKDKQLFFSLIKNGFYLSFGEAVLKNSRVQTLISAVSLEKIFLETDNSEVLIQEIYQKIAVLKRITLEELQEKIYNNFTNVFSGLIENIK